MILPLGDMPNPRGVQVVNWALIAANIAVFLLLTLPLSMTPADPADPLLREYVELLRGRFGGIASTREILASVSSYDLFVFRHGYRPVAPSVQSLFTSMFLHGGFLHLAGNMLFLWIYGDNVEHRLGKVGYLVAYLGTGVAATLGHALFAHDSPLPMVGASGAISGTLGFYFLFFPHNKVRLLLAFFPFLVDVVLVPARWVLGFYLVVENLLPFLANGGGGSGVAHGAHIGGFVAGLGAAWWVERRERVRPPRGYERPRGTRTTEVPAGPDLAELVDSGRYSDAARIYFARDEAFEAALPSPLLLRLADGLARAHPEAALSIYRRVLRRHPAGSTAARAHVGAGTVQLASLGRPAAAWQHFLDALDLDPGGPAAATAREGLRAIESLQSRRR